MTTTQNTSPAASISRIYDLIWSKYTACDQKDEHQRELLATLAVHGTPAKLIEAARDIAVNEGVMAQYKNASKIVAHAMESQSTQDELFLALQTWSFRQMTAGADDTWSGRNNDLQRSIFDGYRAAWRDIMDIATYGW
jgi:hypothetical protein